MPKLPKPDEKTMPGAVNNPRKPITIRLPADVLDQLPVASLTGERSKFILKAIKEKLERRKCGLSLPLVKVIVGKYVVFSGQNNKRLIATFDTREEAEPLISWLEDMAAWAIRSDD